MPIRQRRRLVDEQDTEGGVRLPRGDRHDPRAAGQAGGLRALVQQFQAAFDFRLHGPDRVQESRFGSLGIVQVGVANPESFFERTKPAEEGLPVAA